MNRDADIAHLELCADDGGETHIATAHGTYKTDTEDVGETPWTEGEGVL